MLKKAQLWEKGEGTIVQCKLCAHRCTIKEGKFGICGVRENQEGTLYTYVYGNPIALHVDPIEKKPLYHFLPSSLSYSIATIGCNFKCGFCQNWRISQVSAKALEKEDTMETSPENIVENALNSNCKSIAYTYTEPTIFFEYAYDTSVLAHQSGLKNVFVSNGFMTPEAIEKIQPYLDAANIDLKSFSDDYYKKVCKGRLQPVLDSISNLKKAGVWIEVTTLIIPEETDSDEELNQIAGFIAEQGTDIPWHISRFFPTYNYSDRSPTPISTIKKAERIGRKKGLKHIHLGNI